MPLHSVFDLLATKEWNLWQGARMNLKEKPDLALEYGSSAGENAGLTNGSFELVWDYEDNEDDGEEKRISLDDLGSDSTVADVLNAIWRWLTIDAEDDQRRYAECVLTECFQSDDEDLDENTFVILFKKPSHTCKSCGADLSDDDFKKGKMCCDKPLFDDDTDDEDDDSDSDSDSDDE